MYKLIIALPGFAGHLFYFNLYEAEKQDVLKKKHKKL